MPPPSQIPTQTDNRQAIIGLKSICTQLETIQKQLDEKTKNEDARHKQACTNITNISTKVDAVLKQVTDLDKKVYSIENN